MPPQSLIEDEDYASSEDSDFAPDDAPDREGASSDDDAAQDEGDNNAFKPAPAKRKRKQQAGDGDGDGAENAGFENSGDEAIIEKGKKRRKKGQQAQQGQDDEGGEGGLIKTRSMRAVEKAERKAQASSGPVTIDVDALWASMTAAPVVPTDQPGGSKGEPSTVLQESGQRSDKDAEPSETIKIKRTYNFAGKVHTEEKVVPRDSAEARLYLASLGESGDPNAAAEDGQPDKPPPRRAFRSMFEPVVVLDGQNQRTDLNLGIAMRLQAREQRAKDAKKLNTVEKSRMDWAGFVDKEGIKDELALAGRAKGSFAERQGFLARSEARREEEARRVRMAGKI